MEKIDVNRYTPRPREQIDPERLKKVVEFLHQDLPIKIGERTIDYKDFPLNKSRSGIYDHIGEEFKKSKAWITWTTNHPGAKDNSGYQLGMKDICYFFKTTPDDIVKMRTQEVQDINQESKVKNMIYEMRKYYELCEIIFDHAPKTTHNKDCGVRGFLTRVNPRLSFGGEIKNVKKHKVLKRHTFKLTIDIIKQMVDVANPEEKWIFLFFIQSGLSIGDLRFAEVRYTQDIYNQIFEQKQRIVLFPYIRKKEPEMGYRKSWFGYDALDAFKSYIIKKGIKIDDPLIVGYAQDGKRQFLNEKDMRDAITRLFKRARIETGDLKASTSTCRTYVRDVMTNARIDHIIKDFITAHSVPEQDLAYYMSADDDLRACYDTIREKINPYLATYEKYLSYEEKVDELIKWQKKAQPQIEALYLALTKAGVDVDRVNGKKAKEEKPEKEKDGETDE